LAIGIIAILSLKQILEQSESNLKKAKISLGYTSIRVLMANRHEIKAVHERNLEEMLESLGVLDSVMKGLITCKFCGKKISLENINCVYPKKNEIVFCCDDISCFEKALSDQGNEAQ